MNKATITITTILAAVTAVAVAASSAAADPVEKPLSRDASTALTSILQAPFDSSLRFADALAFAENATAGSVVGIRFENDQIVGEYFLNSDKGPDQFLTEFHDRFQTEPQVTALLVEVPYRAPDPAAEPESRGYSPLATIETGMANFIAPSVPDSAEDSLLGRDRDVVQLGGADPGRAPLAGEWRPAQVHASTVRFAGSQIFSNYVVWYGTDDPASTAGPFGIEVEINLLNGATGRRGDVFPLPFCSIGFRDQFIAKNYDLNSWSTYSPAGGLAAAYPYIDLNDLSDECGRNSMAVGFADMAALPHHPVLGLEVETYIDAKPGVTSSSGLHGTIQMVDSSFCPFDGSIAFTDCMGILTTGLPDPGFRLTLNPDRSWAYAAYDRCWTSNNYGLTSADTFEISCW